MVHSTRADREARVMVRASAREKREAPKTVSIDRQKDGSVFSSFHSPGLLMLWCSRKYKGKRLCTFVVVLPLTLFFLQSRDRKYESWQSHFLPFSVLLYCVYSSCATTKSRRKRMAKKKGSTFFSWGLFFFSSASRKGRNRGRKVEVFTQKWNEKSGEKRVGIIGRTDGEQLGMEEREKKGRRESLIMSRLERKGTAGPFLLRTSVEPSPVHLNCCSLLLLNG